MVGHGNNCTPLACLEQAFGNRLRTGVTHYFLPVCLTTNPSAQALSNSGVSALVSNFLVLTSRLCNCE